MEALCDCFQKTHTDRYLHYNSHHPVSAKRAAVRSLFDRAKMSCYRLTCRQERITSPLHSDGLSSTFHPHPPPSIHEPSTPRSSQIISSPRSSNHWQSSHVCERIRKACGKFDLRVVFKSGPTLRLLLTKVKDLLPKEKVAGVVYQIPCHAHQCILMTS